MDIEQLARQAGWPSMVIDNLAGTEDEKRLQRFANAVLEEAAVHGRLICDYRATEYAHGYNQAALDYEAAIRSMKKE